MFDIMNLVKSIISFKNHLNDISTEDGVTFQNGKKLHSLFCIVYNDMLCLETLIQYYENPLNKLVLS